MVTLSCQLFIYIFLCGILLLFIYLFILDYGQSAGESKDGEMMMTMMMIIFEIYAT